MEFSQGTEKKSNKREKLLEKTIFKVKVRNCCKLILAAKFWFFNNFWRFLKMIIYKVQQKASETYSRFILKNRFQCIDVEEREFSWFLSLQEKELPEWFSYNFQNKFKEKFYWELQLKVELDFSERDHFL